MSNRLRPWKRTKRSSKLKLAEDTVPWPGKSHPEAMKLRCRQGYFHASAQKDNSPRAIRTILHSRGPMVAETPCSTGPTH
jgi:hypothetical protein